MVEGESGGPKDEDVSTVLVINDRGDVFYVGTWSDRAKACMMAEEMKGDNVKDHVEYADSFLFGVIEDSVVQTNELR